MKRLALLSMFMFAACSSNNDHAATQQEYDDVARQLGTSAATGNGGGDVGAMSDSMTVALGGSLAGFTVSATGTLTGSHGSLMYSYDVSCRDANGTVLPVCTRLTDSAAIDLAWSGELALPNLDASVSRRGSWTLAGLQSPTASLDGRGTFTFDAALAASMYHLSYGADYHAVAIDTATKVAIGGEIDYAIDATRTTGNVDESFSIDAALVFHADGSATLTLDGTHEYTVDLETGAVVIVR